ncbi:MAG: hypothetical protein H7Z37_07990, partial [Pyrinomonadaceae bacterium]|nr:hypothetical protein [Pyrinomonadaceae bacterium]
MKKTIWRKLSASVIKLFLPAVLLLVVAFVTASVWLVNMAAVPPHAAYLVTPEQLQKFTKSGSKITDESWSNKDSTKARGWLLRGNENAPAVILLHRYGADRSWLLGFGSKLNQESNFTVLIPDLRGHGDKPLVNATTFGSLEADDLSSAIVYLRGLKTEAG